MAGMDRLKLMRARDAAERVAHELHRGSLPGVTPDLLVEVEELIAAANEALED